MNKVQSVWSFDIATGSASKFTPTEVDVNPMKKVGLNTVEGMDVLFVKLIENGKEI